MYVLNLIGSALPIIVLSFMIVFIIKNKKLDKKVLASYVLIAVLMFFILLRT